MHAFLCGVCIHMCVGACVCAHACGGWRLTLGIPSIVLMFIYLCIGYFTDHGAHQFDQICLSPRDLFACFHLPSVGITSVCCCAWCFFVGSMGWNSGLCVCVMSTLWLTHLPSPQKTLLSILSLNRPCDLGGGLTHNVWCGLDVTCPPKAPALEAGIVIFGGGNIWGVGPRGQRLSHGHLEGLNLVWGLLDLVRVT